MSVSLDRRSRGRGRLLAQGLITRPFATPGDAVRAFGAMQGQELPGALASAALRTQEGSIGAVIADLDAGRIVRGYPMRGTLFLMAAEDLLWVSALCNPGTLKAARKRRGQLGLTDAHVERAREVAQVVLPDHASGLPRAELFAHWERAGTPTAAGCGYHVLAHLIGEGDLCFGPWNGADQNVVTTAQWLPAGTGLDQRFNGDSVPATAELLRRYLSSHGPATLRDFAWWTKLPLRDIRPAHALVAAEFESGTGAGTEAEYWRPGLVNDLSEAGSAVKRPLLLPGFDEFILGYADRLFAMTAEQHDLLVPGNNGVFGRSVVVDAQVRGLWKRAGSPGRRTLEVSAIRPLPARTVKTLDAVFARFPFVGP